MSARRGRVSSVGPDAVHLCLTVGQRPHPFGCAWASYGEARHAEPTTAAARQPARSWKARRVAAPPGPSKGPQDGPPRSRE